MSEAVETSGCVVDEGGAELRLRSTYRVPFAVAGTAGMDVELSDGDFELSLIEFVTRRSNAVSGLGSLPPQGTTAVGVGLWRGGRIRPARPASRTAAAAVPTPRVTHRMERAGGSGTAAASRR